MPFRIRLNLHVLRKTYITNPFFWLPSLCARAQWRSRNTGFVFQCCVRRLSFLNAVFLSNSANSYGFCVNTSGKSDESRFTVDIVESERIFFI